MHADPRDAGSRTPSFSLPVLIGCLVIFVLPALLVFLVAAGLLVYGNTTFQAPGTPSQAQAVPATPTPSLTPSSPASRTPAPLLQPTPTAQAGQALSIEPPEAIVQAPVERRVYDHLDALLTSDYPIHDFYESARRLSSFDVGPRTISREPFGVGSRHTFFVGTETVMAELVAVTDHTYFWVDVALALDPAAVAAVAQRFERDYYPRLVRIFGQEWQPGIDNDPHFSVLHLAALDTATDELGYFDSGNEYPRSFHEISNEQEIIYLNMDNLSLGSDLYYGTLVHEFQHLVQWYVDGNETEWLDEGLAQLAELYVGLETAETRDYLLAPDTQLNSWDHGVHKIYAHYGAAYLFAVYLWEQLGDSAIGELARHPANGLASVSAVLQGYRPGSTVGDLFAAWAGANYLDDPAAGPEYAYRALELSEPLPEIGIKGLPYDAIHEIAQFGVHYVELELANEMTVTFAGDTRAALLPTAPRSGSQMWVAPVQDNVNARLTRAFDLSGLEQATLTFWTWYDLEPEVDYAYVSASADGGKTWELLTPRYSRAGEYGPAFYGRSETLSVADAAGWFQEVVSLDRYAGETVLVRFELLTYHSSQGRGLALDDIAIPELGYTSDVEGGADGWKAAGFVQVGEWLPQLWSVQYIQKGEAPQIMALPLNSLNQGQWTLAPGEEGGVLVISALTPFVYEPASYWLAVDGDR